MLYLQPGPDDTHLPSNGHVSLCVCMNSVKDHQDTLLSLKTIAQAATVSCLSFLPPFPFPESRRCTRKHFCFPNSCSPTTHRCCVLHKPVHTTPRVFSAIPPLRYPAQPPSHLITKSTQIKAMTFRDAHRVKA